MSFKKPDRKLIFLKLDFASPLYDETVFLRDKLLRKPLNLEFTIQDLAEEYKQLHFACYDETLTLLACLVMVPLSDFSIKMRQVAVDTHWQGRGVGRFLVEKTEEYCYDHRYLKIELNARENAIPFYERLNYNKKGESFIEVNIPHIKMYKDF
jgi:predicted GNAT family N-acyltransferase